MMTPLSPSSSMNYESIGRPHSGSFDDNMSADGAPLLEPRSNDYSRYGIRDVPKYTTTTAFGKTKTFAGLFPREWIFLAVSLVNLLTAIGLTVYRMVQVLRDDPESPDFTFTLLLLLNAGFCLFYVFHGVLRERVYELYAFMCAILVVVMYCVLEYFVFNPDGQTVVKLVRMILAVVMAPPNIFLAFIVSQNFGYLEFRIVGASEFLQRLYRQAALFSCLLKFDLQAAISVVVLALREGTSISTTETVSLAVGLPFSLLWCLLGWFTLRREWNPGVWIFAALGVVKPAYYLYKVIEEYMKLDKEDKEAEDTIVNSLIAAAAIGLLVWLLLMFELIYVYRNFDKGLRERVALVATEKTGLLTAFQRVRQPQA
ncbi:hypothetical protein RRG08_040527 [Elysia crispata]|uniref:DUF7789 domain-containing protein n=1 Tax=Elysia crispata TaxID=231223 RepID=A0AAE0Z4W0_9GAST|nr:hypothetical protein RRG08_040527 [Elysia crispata]